MSDMLRHVCFIALGCATLAISPAGAAEPPSAGDIAFFEAKIRPVLVDKCYKCHGAGEANRKAALRLDSRAGLQKGGENGALMDPAKPNESLLLLALRHEGPEMPPDGKLPAAVIADFETWVKRGAPDPRDAPPAAAVARHFLPDVYQQHWALQPMKRPALPVGRS